QVVVVEVGQLGGERIRIGSRQAGAAEHQVDPVVKDVGGNAAPQQLHGGAIAVRRIDTGTAQFQDVSLEHLNHPDVVLVGRVEAAEFFGGIPTDQAIRADDAFRAGADGMIDDKQVIRDGIERIG